MERIHYIKSGNEQRSGEAFLLDRQCQIIRNSIAEACGYEPELAVLDGLETDAGQLGRSLDCGGLFSSARLVLWKNPAPLVSSHRSHEKSDDEILNVLENLLHDQHGECFLAVIHLVEKTASFKKRAKKQKNSGKDGTAGSRAGWLGKWLLRNARVYDLQPLAPGEMKAWLAREMMARGLGSDADAISELARSGQDMYYIITLLDKMSLICGSNPLKKSDLAADLVELQESNIFELLDKLRSREGIAALSILGKLLEKGESPIGIVAMMARDLKHMAYVKALKEDRVDESQLPVLSGLPAWQLSRYHRSAGHFTWGELEKISAGLLEADIAMKNSAQNQRLLLEGLAVEYGRK